MGLCVSIDIKDRVILIVGGGHVALRKAQLFLKEGAVVSIVAPQIQEAFFSMPCTCIHKAYDKHDLHGCFMVVAASNEHVVNTQVIHDANTLGILSMSVEQDADARMHALAYHDNGNFQLAVSTKKQVPALNRVILDDVVRYVDKRYTQRLTILKELRKYILSNTKIENKHDVLRYLAKSNIDILQFVLDAIHKQKCMVLCFHGVRPEESIDEIKSFIEQVKSQLSAYAVGFAYLSNAIVKSVNVSEHKVLSITSIMDILSFFDIETTLYPMLFQEGRFYDELLTYANAYTRVCKPPFHNVSDMRELIRVCFNVHKEQQHMICIYHSSKIGKFASLLDEVKKDFPNVLFLHEAYKDAMDIPYHDEVVSIFPLYMLKGRHMCCDLSITSPLMKQLSENNCKVLCNTDSCLKQRDIQKLCIDKIVKEA